MTLLWIPFTIMAAFMQSWRNALQKQLRQHASTLGVTLARFVFALPLSVIYLLGLYHVYPTAHLPHFNGQFFCYIIIASLTQIVATALMVQLFKTRNYAIGVGLAKSEAVIAAILGAIFFGSALPLLAWVGVALGSVAVWLMSLNNGKDSSNDRGIDIPVNTGLSVSTISIGIGSGLCFALCTLFIRQASLILQQQTTLNNIANTSVQSFLLSAGWVLFFVLFIQTVLLTLWLAYTEPSTLKTLYNHKKLTMSVSMFSFIGSIGWFTAMSLQTVALVKTLGQIEIMFTLAISTWWFKERLGRNDYVGLGLIMLGAILVVVA